MTWKAEIRKNLDVGHIKKRSPIVDEKSSRFSLEFFISVYSLSAILIVKTIIISKTQRICPSRKTKSARSTKNKLEGLEQTRKTRTNKGIDQNTIKLDFTEPVHYDFCWL